MWCCPPLKRKLMVAGGRERKKKGKKRKEKKTRWVQDGSSGNYVAMPALNLVRKSVRYKKQEKRKEKQSTRLCEARVLKKMVDC